MVYKLTRSKLRRSRRTWSVGVGIRSVANAANGDDALSFPDDYGGIGGSRVSSRLPTTLAPRILDIKKKGTVRVYANNLCIVIVQATRSARGKFSSHHYYHYDCCVFQFVSPYITL